MRLYAFTMSTIKHIRLTLFKMDQKEFANAIGVNQTTVSRWENGTNITIENAKHVRDKAIALGLPWRDELLFEEPHPDYMRRLNLENRIETALADREKKAAVLRAEVEAKQEKLDAYLKESADEIAVMRSELETLGAELQAAE